MRQKQKKKTNWYPTITIFLALSIGIGFYVKTAYLTPKEEIVEYIALASKRNLASFLLGGDPRLDCRLVKTLPTNTRLITIENNHISCAYEQG